MTPTEAMNKLLTRPAEFLKYYPVKTAGSSAPAAGVATTKTFYLDKQSPRSIPNPSAGPHAVKADKPGHTGATRPGIFGRTHEISSFKFGTVPAAGGATTTAVVVPMVNYNSDKYGCPNLNGDVSAMPHYVVDGSGNGLMITGELSGCCFCWVVNGNDLWCTHVQPSDDTNGTFSGDELQVELRHGGGFAAGGGPLHTFGRKEYPAGRATVIGVRSGGSWSLYAQTSNDSMKTLTGAYRIYPGGYVPL